MDEQQTLFRIVERKAGYLVLFVNGKQYPNDYQTREQAERAAEAINRYWTEGD